MFIEIANKTWWFILMVCTSQLDDDGDDDNDVTNHNPLELKSLKIFTAPFRHPNTNYTNYPLILKILGVLEPLIY